ncbi:MAG: cation diffusion facilitator family transporter [Lachnospiraceae bacterium]|nr:cation diffusion facilitator family transporter [Lachnospiraceae bacterium]
MENEFEKTAIRVSMVSVIWNIILSVFKLIAGLVAHSGAMISDAVHSASDVFSSIVVMVGVRISGKESDKNHPYGHERMECVAAIVLATVLAVTGLGIGCSAIASLNRGDYAAKMPGILALVAAVVSILVKEAMFWYTRHYAKQIDSSAVMADAWHHRSDALSSVGALIGIGGARLGFPIMEPVASVVICVFIEKAAFDIFVDAINKMVDRACDEQTQKAIKKCALGIDGVERVDLLKTRIFGNKVYVEMEIGADENLSLKESHAIAQKVHDSIEKGWPKVKHILIHVNPVKM